MQLDLAFVDLYIYGQEEVVASGLGLHLLALDPYQASALIEILGDISGWILEILEVSNAFKIVMKELMN